MESFIKGSVEGFHPFTTYTFPSPLKERGIEGGEVDK